MIAALVGAWLPWIRVEDLRIAGTDYLLGSLSGLASILLLVVVSYHVVGPVPFPRLTAFLATVHLGLPVAFGVRRYLDLRTIRGFLTTADLELAGEVTAGPAPGYWLTTGAAALALLFTLLLWRETRRENDER